MGDIRRCENCIYYSPRSDHVDVESRTITEMCGGCRRNSPTDRWCPTIHDQVQRWVSPDFWCGEGLFKGEKSESGSIPLYDLSGNRKGFFFQKVVTGG